MELLMVQLDGDRDVTSVPWVVKPNNCWLYGELFPVLVSKAELRIDRHTIDT